MAWRTDETGESALNLTRATLAAIMKYPWVCGEAPAGENPHKWSAYYSESGEGDVYSFALGGRPPGARTLEAQIMDWADDIAYAVHDVEDFYRAGLVPLERLANSEEAQWFIGQATPRLKGLEPDKAVAAFSRLRADHLPRAPYRGTKEDQTTLAKLSSFLITRYINAASVEDDGSLFIAESERGEVSLLKQLTWVYMIENPSLGSLQQGQRRVIRTLFAELDAWTRRVTDAKKGREQLPVQLWELLSNARADKGTRNAYGSDDTQLRARAIVDYIAGLTEPQAMDLYERITGVSAGSALNTWLRTS